MGTNSYCLIVTIEQAIDNKKQTTNRIDLRYNPPFPYVEEPWRFTEEER